MSRKEPWLLTLIFLSVELILYLLILTTGGTLLVACSYGAIVVCFLYALLTAGNRFIIGGLACTVMADLFLVVCSPIRQLDGMIFFLTAQTLYAAMLHRAGRNKGLLFARIALVLAATAIAFAVLKERTDALAVVSVCYYANLIMSIVEAFTLFSKNRLFPMGLVLFLLCDTVIGLQAACGTYLTIREQSVIYRIIFMDFHLSWSFYLPSQVLIALSGRKMYPSPSGK